ncbi:MAG: lysine--tRNA ligase [Gammaproteobacteria bacterium]
MVSEQQHDESEVIAVRKQKLAKLQESGFTYPNSFRINHLATDIHKQYAEETAESLLAKKVHVAVAGRIMLRRIMGKASFVHIQDMSGRIQLYVRKDELLDDAYSDFKTWDLGDIIGAEGELFKTKTGELTVKITKICLLNKTVRPLPDKFHGLTNRELCYRQRYADLLVNEATRKTFLIRSKLISTIRQFLCDRQFLEVETPMMQSIPGGAAARPFVTHHNSLDMDLYLRVSPELYLKRLVVGGFDRVFEINRNFRNEGLSTQHNPEFTMLEFYQAYADYNDLIVLTEEMLRYAAQQILMTTTIIYQGQEIDFSKPFIRMTVKEAILHYNLDISAAELNDEACVRKIAQRLGISLQDNFGLGKIQIEIFEKTVEAQLQQPTFITAYPTEVSPLARRNNDDPSITDRFEFFVVGREIANGFSELNDPQDQAQRFKQQVAQRREGDLEAMYYDADYIMALEYGLPPTAGEGIGIDRLAMLFTNSPSIRDVILFPHMRRVKD